MTTMSLRRENVATLTLECAVVRDVELTAPAMEAIGDYYAELRSESATGALPVTVRRAAHACQFCREICRGSQALTLALRGCLIDIHQELCTLTLRLQAIGAAPPIGLVHKRMRLEKPARTFMRSIPSQTLTPWTLDPRLAAGA